jgi:ElaB/YqjD/DUF883 family membrane-anchored ribosome-binding protein
MDNQKTNEGSGRDIGQAGAGSSMGKDLGGKSGAGTPGSSGTTGGAGMAGVAQDLSRGTNDLHKTIDKATTAEHGMVDRVASTAHQGVDKVSGALSDAGARMEEKSRQLSEAYRHFADTGRDYVRSSPATSILVALAAGYTLSKLLSRRN